MQFEWDLVKAAANAAKHRVTFHEAATAFIDDLSWTIPDPDHSESENRFLTVGMASSGRLLIVAHTAIGEVIRIISARETTRRERRFYEEGA